MKVIYDAKLYRPACVLLQAALGGDRAICRALDSSYWLIAPTPDMGAYEVTPEELAQLVKITEAKAVFLKHERGRDPRKLSTEDMKPSRPTKGT